MHCKDSFSEKKQCRDSEFCCQLSCRYTEIKLNPQAAENGQEGCGRGLG